MHSSAKKDPNREYTHWEENYNLQDPGKLALFEEYLEMGTSFSLHFTSYGGSKVSKLTLSCANFSNSIRICDVVRGCVSLSTVVRFAE